MELYNSWKFNLTLSLFALLLVIMHADVVCLLIAVMSYYLALVNFDEEQKILEFEKRCENVLHTES